MTGVGKFVAALAAVMLAVSFAGFAFADESGSADPASAAGGKAISAAVRSDDASEEAADDAGEPSSASDASGSSDTASEASGSAGSAAENGSAADGKAKKSTEVTVTTVEIEPTAQTVIEDNETPLAGPRHTWDWVTPFVIISMAATGLYVISALFRQRKHMAVLGSYEKSIFKDGRPLV